MLSKFLSPGAASLGAALLLLASSASGANLYLSNAQGIAGGLGSFQGQFLFNAAPATSSGMYGAGSPSLNQEWQASADATTGTLRVRSLADNTGGDPLTTFAMTSVIAALADTFTYAGSATGQTLSANIDLTGTWSAFTTGSATMTNLSYLRVYFLQPGSLDAPSILASGNIISQAAWGLGPDAQQNPGVIPYSGFLPGFPATVALPIPVTSLPNGFQVLVLLQLDISGDTNGGVGASLGWSADLGNTAHFSIDAPAALGLTSAAGTPITNSSAVPEPSTVGLAVAGLALAARRHLKGVRRDMVRL